MGRPSKLQRFGLPDGFYYTDSTGQKVTNPAIIEYVQNLVIPPAWQNVLISTNPNSKVLATGYDAAGRKQYLYNPKFRAQQERAKFDRILAFANALPMMREITGQHLRQRKLSREKVLACMVRLIDLAYFRVGSERYAAENHTFGIATMRSRHLKIVGDTMIFEYVGKSHKPHHQEIEDHDLSRIVRQIDELPGYEIFKYVDEHKNVVDVKSGDVNDYIKQIMGYDFSAKDFRTWAGTLIAAVALAEIDTNLPPSRAKREIAKAVRHVSEHLGNTPAIARASYIDPRIIDHYLQGQTIKNYLKRTNYYLKQSESNHFSQAEVAVLKLLKRRLKKASLA